MTTQGTGTQVKLTASLKLGTAPVNWNNFDLQDWRPIVPFPQILDEMHTAGYAATEWDASFGTNADSLNCERVTRSMAFTGAYRWLDFLHDRQFERDIEEITPFLATLKAVDATHLIVADSLRPRRVACAGSVPTDGSESLDTAGYDRIVTNLERLHEMVAPLGFHLHYHNHVGSYIESPAELEELQTRLSGTAVDLCFDTGHYAFGGGDALSFVAANVGAIGYLHLKDVDSRVLADARLNRWSFQEALRNYIFCPLGDGDAQIAAILEVLVNDEFDNYVIIEQDTCREDQTQNARHNLDVAQLCLATIQERRQQS